MHARIFHVCILLLSLMATQSSAQPTPAVSKLIIVDPGHFHASLIQKEMYASLSKRVSVYAPLGPELFDYLNRIFLFNTRQENPTAWELDIHTAGDSMAAMLRDRPGNVVVLTGRNRGKIDRVLASLSAGLNVFADKPWIISSTDMPKLESALDRAERTGLVAYDIMTERYEVTSELQRVIVNSPEVFGQLATGDAQNPAIRAKSIHHIMKVVAGTPLRRPAWFFDIAEYGEGLADVGTHVVDLVQWTAFPDQALEYRKDIPMLQGRHWPILITKAQFEQVTGAANFPAALASHVADEKLSYFCNNEVSYVLRGIYVNLDIRWDWQAPEGSGDVYEASFQGTQSRVDIRQGRTENFVSELYIVPVNPNLRTATFAALRKKVYALQSHWPGLAVEESDQEARIVIPERYRVGHEAHFAQVTQRLFGYLQAPKSLPSWERPNMLAKYYVSTKGFELAQNPK